MEIIKKIKELNLPKDSYVVIASAVLDILGIRKADDIDIAVTKDTFEKLINDKKWKEEKRKEGVFLMNDAFEISLNVLYGDYKASVEELLENSLIIDGIPFMNLYELIKFKTALGREKDKNDIELIKNYLDNKGK